MVAPMSLKSLMMHAQLPALVSLLLSAMVALIVNAGALNAAALLHCVA